MILTNNMIWINGSKFIHLKSIMKYDHLKNEHIINPFENIHYILNALFLTIFDTIGTGTSNDK